MPYFQWIKPIQFYRSLNNSFLIKFLMDLDQQIQALINNGPQDRTTAHLVAAIAPGLKMIAQQLEYGEYYILQTVDQRWVLTTLSNLKQPKLEKRVIYAYPCLEDAATQANAQTSPADVAQLPVISLLFQMLALPMLDSLIFFDNPGSFESGTEVKQEEVQTLVRSYLQHYQSTQPPSNLA